MQKTCDKSTFQRIVNLIKKKHTLFNNKIRQIFCVCFKISEREINSYGVLPQIRRDCIDCYGRISGKVKIGLEECTEANRKTNNKK